MLSINTNTAYLIVPQLLLQLINVLTVEVVSSVLNRFPYSTTTSHIVAIYIRFIFLVSNRGLIPPLP